MEVLSILFSGLAAIGSFISIFISVRQGYAQIISAQRFDWIENVRRTISDFLDVFFDESISVAMKKKILEKKKGTKLNYMLILERIPVITTLTTFELSMQ